MILMFVWENNQQDKYLNKNIIEKQYLWVKIIWKYFENFRFRLSILEGKKKSNHQPYIIHVERIQLLLIKHVSSNASKSSKL